MSEQTFPLSDFNDLESSVRNITHQTRPKEQKKPQEEQRSEKTSVIKRAWQHFTVILAVEIVVKIKAIARIEASPSATWWRSSSETELPVMSRSMAQSLTVRRASMTFCNDELRCTTLPMLGRSLRVSETSVRIETCVQICQLEFRATKIAMALLADEPNWQCSQALIEGGVRRLTPLIIVYL